jgi:hypothetical protein
MRLGVCGYYLYHWSGLSIIALLSLALPLGVPSPHIMVHVLLTGSKFSTSLEFRVRPQKT